MSDGQRYYIEMEKGLYIASSMQRSGFYIVSDMARAWQCSRIAAERALERFLFAGFNNARIIPVPSEDKKK